MPIAQFSIGQHAALQLHDLWINMQKTISVPSDPTKGLASKLIIHQVLLTSSFTPSSNEGNQWISHMCWHHVCPLHFVCVHSSPWGLKGLQIYQNWQLTEFSSSSMLGYISLSGSLGHIYMEREWLPNDPWLLIHKWPMQTETETNKVDYTNKGIFWDW